MNKGTNVTAQDKLAAKDVVIVHPMWGQPLLSLVDHDADDYICITNPDVNDDDLVLLRSGNGFRDLDGDPVELERV